MPLYDYCCEACGHEQEIIHKMDEENKEKCETCGAEPEKMTKQLSVIGKHGSWSRVYVV
jgi:putative FmdB family regulatory protein